MSRNKYGVHHAMIRKADSMRNPEYIKLPKGSMTSRAKRNDILQLVNDISYSASPYGRSADMLRDYMQRLRKPSSTTKRMSSVRKANSMRNPGYVNLPKSSMVSTGSFTPYSPPTDYKRLASEHLGNIKAQSMDAMDSFNAKVAPFLRSVFPPIPTMPPGTRPSKTPPTPTPMKIGKRMKSSVRKASSDSMRNPAYVNLPKGTMQSPARALRYWNASDYAKRRLYNAKEKLYDFQNNFNNAVDKVDNFVDKASRFGNVLGRKMQNQLPQRGEIGSFIRDVRSYKKDPKNLLYLLGGPLPYMGMALIDANDKRMNRRNNGLQNQLGPAVKRMSTVRKASSDSMRNPKYLTMGRSPAEETIGMKARARVNRAVGNPLETVLTMLQGKDVRNNVKATQNTNRRMARMAEEMLLRNDRKNRVPEYTRLPKSNTLDAGRKVIATVNRLRSVSADPMEQVLSVLQRPAVLARMMMDKQSKNSGVK